MLSRRDLVGKLGVGTAALCVVGVAKTSSASAAVSALNSRESGSGECSADLPPASEAAQTIVDAEAPATLAAAAPWKLLRPLAVGAAVAPGWHLAGFTGVVDGSCVLTLQNERGRAHRVHVCRNDGAPQGLAHTKRFDLIVMNGGEGDLPTDENLAQAIAAVARVMAANEGKTRQEVAALLTHNERVRLFSGDLDRRLR
jgi:hypothetical protein